MKDRSKKKTKSISAVEARSRFGKLLNEVQEGEHYLIIERKGRPIVAILSIEEFEDYLDLRYDDHPAIKETLIESQKEYEMGQVGSLDDLYRTLKPLKDTTLDA